MSRTPLTKLSQLLLTLNPFEFATFAYILGLILSEGLNANELSALGNFYNLLGETMQTIGAQLQNINPQSSSSPNVNSILDELKDKIDNIDEIIQKFKDI